MVVKAEDGCGPHAVEEARLPGPPGAEVVLLGGVRCPRVRMSYGERAPELEKAPDRDNEQERRRGTGAASRGVACSRSGPGGMVASHSDTTEPGKKGKEVAGSGQFSVRNRGYIRR